MAHLLTAHGKDGPDSHATLRLSTAEVVVETGRGIFVRIHNDRTQGGAHAWLPEAEARAVSNALVAHFGRLDAEPLAAWERELLGLPPLVPEHAFAVGDRCVVHYGTHYSSWQGEGTVEALYSDGWLHVRTDRGLLGSFRETDLGYPQEPAPDRRFSLGDRVRVVATDARPKHWHAIGALGTIVARLTGDVARHDPEYGFIYCVKVGDRQQYVAESDLDAAPAFVVGDLCRVLVDGPTADSGDYLQGAHRAGDLVEVICEEPHFSTGSILTRALTGPHKTSGKGHGDGSDEWWVHPSQIERDPDAVIPAPEPVLFEVGQRVEVCEHGAWQEAVVVGFWTSRGDRALTDDPTHESIRVATTYGLPDEPYTGTGAYDRDKVRPC